MEPTNIIALAAIGISTLTFVFTQLTSKKSARKDYVEELEDRIVALEKELAAVIVQRDSYRDENIILMRKLVRLSNGDTGH